MIIIIHCNHRQVEGRLIFFDKLVHLVGIVCDKFKKKIKYHITDKATSRLMHVLLHNT